MTQNKTSFGIVDEYLNALLVDTQITGKDSAQHEPVLRFAHVKRGNELVAFWRGTLDKPQQLVRDLMLLSLCRTVPGERLKLAMLNSMTLIGH